MYKIGYIVKDRYKIEKVLGQGGMATVFKAYDKINNVNVAIKQISEEVVKKNAFENYHIEKSVSDILGKNNNVIRLYDEFQNGDEWVIILECVEGGSLTEYINFFACLTKNELKDYFLKIASALKLAHELKIVHRDIKTDNILFNQYHLIKLGDFGIAMTEWSDDKERTKRIGTPSYMPPEQIQLLGYSYLSDIYSLGCTIYYAAIGELPFTSQEKDIKKRNNMLLKKQCTNAPIKPSLLNPLFDYQWDELILKMLEKDSKKRYQSMDEVIKALENIDVTQKNTKEYKFSKKYKGKTEKRSKTVYIVDANKRIKIYQKNIFIYCLIGFLILIISTFIILLVCNV